MTTKILPLKATNVFKSVRVGALDVGHKIVHAPTTRMRALQDHCPSNLQVQYYADRSRFPGSLLISEATLATDKTGFYPTVPGIYTNEHVKAWHKVTDAVHANKLFIACQLWLLGRISDPKLQKSRGHDLTGPSAVYPDRKSEEGAEAAGNPLRELTTEEIQELINVDLPNAASKAIEAGFDLVEIHAATGYLFDQFLHPSSNQRSDKYGGSIENRCRFVLELIDKLTETVGAEKIGIRFSPWGTFQGLKGASEEVSPEETFSYLIEELQKRADVGQELAYISLVEPRVDGIVDVKTPAGSNAFATEIWAGTLIRSGNYTYDTPSFETLIKDIDNMRTLVGFLRYYTSNPDFVQRLHDGLPLTKYDRQGFYAPYNWQYNTYNDYGETSDYDKKTEMKNMGKPIDD